MRSSCTLLALFGFPLQALAEPATFQDYSILSRMAIASSQSYQIQKQRCELAGLFTQGNLVSKTIELTLEARSEGAGFHCGQSLADNSLVMGIQGDIQQRTMDGVIVRYEELTTNYQPYVAFQLSPMLSFGVSQEFESGEYKNMSGKAAANTQRLLLSGTAHDGPWELTLSYADRYRGTLAGFDVPRSLGLAGRYQVSPLLTAGFIYTRIDFPGIASGAESLEVGQDTLLSLASQMTPEVMIELSLMNEKNGEGSPDSKSNSMALRAEYGFESGLKAGASINQYKSTSDAFDISMTAFAFSLALVR